MQHRAAGLTQEVAAAKSGLSVRSGRRIVNGEHTPREEPRRWRTRTDPLELVWASQLEPLLQAQPSLTGLTLLEYLDERYPGQYAQSVLRTLQRRVRKWQALHGPDKDVIFLQQAQVGHQGLSDFTRPSEPITIDGEPLDHLLFQFRLAYSGWRSVTVVQGGESYSALAQGLQRALRQAGGSPREHRTDSLSAARVNVRDTWTRDYERLCRHYGMQATRNNLGVAHENGAVETAHGSLKRRLSQSLRLRASNAFDSIAHYQEFVDQVVARLNRRVSNKFVEEQATLQALPPDEVASYRWCMVRVTRSATIELKRCLYTVPARLVGQRLGVRVYHDKLKLYVDHSLALTLPRVYPKTGQTRSRRIDYRHVIHALAAKPQAFRYSQFRDDLLPNSNYRKLWELINQRLSAHEACKWIVTVLRLGYEYDCESQLGSQLVQTLTQGPVPSLVELQQRFIPSKALQFISSPQPQHTLSHYDHLLSHTQTQPEQAVL